MFTCIHILNKIKFFLEANRSIKSRNRYINLSAKKLEVSPIFGPIGSILSRSNCFSFPFACRIKYSNCALSFNGHERRQPAKLSQPRFVSSTSARRTIETVSSVQSVLLRTRVEEDGVDRVSRTPRLLSAPAHTTT